MTIYRYNNIFVHHCKTLSFSQEQEKDPYGVDTLWTKYTIRVRGFVVRSSGSPNHEPTAAVIAAIKSALLIPRKPFLYKIGDVEVINLTEPPDAKLGPDPLPVVVTEVTSGMFMVECGVVVRLVDCPSACYGSHNKRNPILSLRWTQTESFDENWYSRLTTEGRLIVRHDLRQSADLFRPLATPPLLPDYQRMSARYTLAPDGLELAFQFEDQEMDRLAPFPATTAEGSYTVTSEFPGFKRIGNVHIRLEGQKGTPRRLLLIRACQMAYSKLRADGFQSSPPIIWGHWKEDLFKPSVEVSMQSLMTSVTPPPTVPALSRVATVAGVGALALVGGGALAGLIPDFVAGAVGLGRPPAPAPAAPAPVAAAPAAPVVDLAAAFAAGAGAEVTPAGMIAGGLSALVAARLDGELAKATPMMPSCGRETDGLKSNQPGISPPDRKRLARLLTAAFRDPCACVTAESVTKLTEPRVAGTHFKDGDMVDSRPVPAASIAVAPLPPEVDDPGRVAGWATDLAPYDTYELEIHTVFDSGRVLMPATGVGASGHVAAAVTAHGGVMKRMVSWVAGRTGKPPVLPSWETGDPNLVPLTGSVVAQDVKLSADAANLQYMLAGYYVYGVLDPKKYEILPGVAPFYNDDVRKAAAAAASSWKEALAADSASGQSLSAVNANPFVGGGAEPVRVPEVPVGFGVQFGGEQSDQLDTAPAQTQPTASQYAPYYYTPPNNA